MTRKLCGREDIRSRKCNAEADPELNFRDKIIKTIFFTCSRDVVFEFGPIYALKNIFKYLKYRDIINNITITLK